MKKLIQGIVDFRTHHLEDYKRKFSPLALGQAPDALFIACSDSRVVPNLFASSDPGDLFVIRNVGNLIPPCKSDGTSEGDIAEWAAIEFSLLDLPVTDIVVCGHSECGAIKAIIDGRQSVKGDHLRQWLSFGEQALSLVSELSFSTTEPLSFLNKVSQANVVLQLKHLETYPLVKERITQKKLRLHGWWFCLSSGNVYFFNQENNGFQLIDEKATMGVIDEHFFPR